jgi:hypothetical protein
VSLAYASQAEKGHAIPIAVVFASSASPSLWGPIFIREGWQEAVKETHQAYLDDVFQEWAQPPAGITHAMMSRLLELSVGPLRTVEVGECSEHELIQRAETFLDHSFQRLI